MPMAEISIEEKNAQITEYLLNYEIWYEDDWADDKPPSKSSAKQPKPPYYFVPLRKVGIRMIDLPKRAEPLPDYEIPF